VRVVNPHDPFELLEAGLRALLPVNEDELAHDVLALLGAQFEQGARVIGLREVKPTSEEPGFRQPRFGIGEGTHCIHCDTEFWGGKYAGSLKA